MGEFRSHGGEPELASAIQARRVTAAPHGLDSPVRAGGALFPALVFVALGVDLVTAALVVSGGGYGLGLLL